jgi:DNA-binding transcriptional LysR family regulator
MKENSYIMTLNQLQVFMEVVEKNSFTLAANSINMTQSAVSHAIASLEAELGVTLLERDRKGIGLTEVGRQVWQHAREIMIQAENIRQKTAAARGLAKGRIRLGTFPSTSARLLPGIIREFQQRYPGIEIVLFEGTDFEVHGWIINRAVDLGFVTLPAEGIETMPIAQDAMLVIMASSNPLSTAKKLTLKQLANEPFIMFKDPHDTAIQTLFHKNKVEFHPKYEALANPTVLAMVQEGLGVAIVPELILPIKLGEDMVAIQLDPPAVRSLAFGVRSVAELSPAVASFIQQAQDWSKSHGYFPKD